MFYLYKDLSDEFNETYSKVVRAPYETLEDAMRQAEHDLFYGYRVIGIEEADGELGGEHHTALERGRMVWKPEGGEHEDFGRLMDLEDEEFGQKEYDASLKSRVEKVK